MVISASDTESSVKLLSYPFKEKPAEYLCCDPILNGKQHTNSL